MSVFKNVLKAALMTGAAAWFAASAAFANDAKYNFDMPAQNLSQSLFDLSARTGVPVVADGALVEDEKAPALRGRMTPAEALEILLAPSGLSYERDRTTVYRVVEPAPVIEIPDADNLRAPRDEIIVTGTNIRTASHIRGAPTDSAPLLEFNQKDIAQSGYRSAEEFIQVQPASFGGPRSNPFEFVIVPVFRDPFDVAPIGSRPILREPFLEQNGVSIHGLTPLTLVNGRRFLGDLATLPVTAIERIDVLADGASAIYGDGAVPGVVNAVLIDEFDGVRTTARYGAVADSGAEEYLAAITAGKSWGGGKITGTYEFLERTNLTFADRGYVSSRSFLFSGDTIGIPEAPVGVDILPGEQRHRAYIRGEQAITNGLALYAEGSASVVRQISEATSFFPMTPAPEFLFSIRTAQYATTLGARIDLGGEWQSDIALHRSVVNTVSRPSRGSLWTVKAKADGPFFDAPGGAAKLAVGGEYRAETPFVEGASTFDAREIFSAFGETFIPLISEANGRSGVERLELSLAGRFDHYEDSGGVLSPRISLLWSPLAGLNLRGSYGRSHQQPVFSDFGDGAASIFVANPTGRSCPFLPPCVLPPVRPVVLVFPEQIDLPPARSDNITIGADYSPPYLPGLSLSATYYDIDFTGQPISTPLDPSLEDQFPGTNFFNITQEFADDIATIVMNDAVRFGLPFNDCIRSPLFVRSFADIPIYGDDFATRCVRLSEVVSSGDFGAIINSAQGTGRTKTRGLDLSATYGVSTGAGDFNVFANANVVLEFTRRLNSFTPVVDAADTFSNPLDYRLRGGVSWSLKGFNAAAIVNHADSYSYTREPGFPRLIIESNEPVIRVDSLTSLDLYIAYNTGEKSAAGLLRNLEFSVSAINVTNETPQALQGARLGFDDFNADPTGRFVAFQVTKKW